MPYKIDKIHAKLPINQDKRRCKLTDKDRNNIKELYRQGWAKRKIARYYEDKCSRRLIIFIIHPERLEIMKKEHKAKKHHLKYYKKDKWRIYMRKHRQHRKKVFAVKDAPPLWTKSEYKMAYSELGRKTLIRTGERTAQAVYSKRYREKIKSLK